jgi:hypothetical protein
LIYWDFSVVPRPCVSELLRTWVLWDTLWNLHRVNPASTTCVLYMAAELASSRCHHSFPLCPLEQWLQYHLWLLKPQLGKSSNTAPECREKILDVVLGNKPWGPTYVTNPSFAIVLPSRPRPLNLCWKWQPQISPKWSLGHYPKE